MMPDPHIFDVDPEEETAPAPFDVLYQQARRHFCYHLWQASGDGHFAGILHQREDAWLRRLIEELITKTWREVAPAEGQIGPYLKADPGLIQPHEDQKWVAGREPQTPEEAARFNVFSWLHKSLWSFWENRFDGHRAIVVRVTRTGITIKGVLPIDVAQTLYQEETDLPMTHESTDLIYDDASDRRPTPAPEEPGDLPF